MRRCLLVDFDGTMTQCDTTRFLALSLVRFRPWLLFYIFYGYLRLSLSKNDHHTQFWKNWCIGKLLRGLSCKDLTQPLNMYKQRVLPILRKDVLNHLRESQAAGDSVLIVTASFEDAVAHVLNEQGFFILGGRFLQTQGVFSDSTIKPDCFAEGKVVRIHDWAKNEGDDLVYTEAWSDSLSDVAMLCLAEKKVWVCRAHEINRLTKVFPNAQFWDVDQSV